MLLLRFFEGKYRDRGGYPHVASLIFRILVLPQPNFEPPPTMVSVFSRTIFLARRVFEKVCLSVPQLASSAADYGRFSQKKRRVGGVPPVALLSLEKTRQTRFLEDHIFGSTGVRKSLPQRASTCLKRRRLW